MTVLLHPTYFPNVVSMALLVQHDIIWEVNDNYQKQTFRNRCHICNDSGKHLLSIPIQHVGSDQGRQQYRNVLLDDSYAWQRQHWRTLETAYRTSPFFEFYEDDLLPLFETKYTHLLQFNLATIDFICKCLQIAVPTKKTHLYEKNPPTLLTDGRFLVNAKEKRNVHQVPYVQVFGDRHGFVQNTSALDLLFNEGPNALSYLKAFDTQFLNG